MDEMTERQARAALRRNRRKRDRAERARADAMAEMDDLIRRVQQATGLELTDIAGELGLSRMTLHNRGHRDPRRRR